jgi:glycosyltransferase involved in cell wall biosynthesis
MRILLSAFTCDPRLGSEAAVGWAWACELAAAGNEVFVLTRSRQRVAIEYALSRTPIPGLHFIYIDVHSIPWVIPFLRIYPHYFAWQLKAARLVPGLLDLSTIDCVHHITIGTFRTPFFLARLGVPSIFGPVGGGETTPFNFIRDLPLRGKVREIARAAAVFVERLNPMNWMTWRRSTMILATSADTLKMVPKRYRHKARVMPAVTTPFSAAATTPKSSPKPGTFRALFVGRLLEWKGPHLAIEAVNIARQSIPGLTLTIVGNGRSEPWVRQLVKQKHLEDQVRWVSTVPREQLLDLYDTHDVLLFMNIRDAGGTVVLEALARGLPTVYLKLGAFGTLLDGGAGVEIAGKSPQQICAAVALEMVRLSSLSSAQRKTMREASSELATQFTPQNAVNRAYSWFEEIGGAAPTLKNEPVTQNATPLNFRPSGEP